MLIESEETKKMVLLRLPSSISQDKNRLFIKYAPVGKVAVILSM